MRIFQLKVSSNYSLFIDLDRVISVAVDAQVAYFTLTSPLLDRYGRTRSGYKIPADQVEAFLKAWKNELPNEGPYR